MQKISGFSEAGNTTLTITGAAGTITRKVEGSFPLATITVFNAGTVALATIYADDALTPKANPFVSAADATWFFYASDGTYDVQFSGGNIPTPFTIGALQAFDVQRPDLIRSAARFPGADLGARIQAAHNDLPATGGTIDARGLEGTQSIASTVTFTLPVRLLLPDATITASSLAFDIQASNCVIEGNMSATVLKMGSANPLIRLNNISNCTLRDFRIDGNARAFAANGIVVGTAAGTTSLTQFDRLYFIDIQGSAIALTSIASWNDAEVHFCIASNCGTATVPAIDLAGFVDTARFTNNQWEGFLGIGLSGSANVQRVRVRGDKFHGALPSNTNIAISWNGFRSAFIGCQFNFIQGTEQVLCTNVDNIFLANEHTDPGTATHGYVFSGSASRIRCIANELSGPALYTGDAVQLNAVGDCQIHFNSIRNAGASAGSFGIHEVNAADRNLVAENICINVGTVETITGVNSLFSDNGVLDSQLLIRRTQKFSTGDAAAPPNSGDAAVKRTGSHLGTLYFDDQKAFIVGYGNSGGNKIESYVNSVLRSTLDATRLLLSGIYYDTTGAYRVNNVQVVGAQGATIPDIALTSGGTYTANEQQMLTDLKNDVNAILSRMRAHGLIAT